MNTQQLKSGSQYNKTSPGLRTLLVLILTATLFLSGITNATESLLENTVTIDRWVQDANSDVPIIHFNSTSELDLITRDIKTENIITEVGGSIRFQLSYSTPFGRTIFANVIKTDLGNGMSRSTMTNIADGKQTVFITQNDSLKLINYEEIQAVDAVGSDESSPEYCLPCVLSVIATAEAIACAAGSYLSSLQCASLCSETGVDEYESGICGTVNAVCKCNPPPPREVEIPGPGV